MPRTKKAQKIHQPSIDKNMKVSEVEPMTATQQDFLIRYNQEQDGHFVLHGFAGTGKTFMALYAALSDIGQNFYKSVTVVRSAVPSRDVGFLPGSLEEKTEIYELPYKSIVKELYQRGDAYEILKQKKMLNFVTTSFIRGITIENSIVVVDEVQNMTDEEINTIITRLGRNTRIILCGDFRQKDLNKPHDKSGINQLLKIASAIPSFNILEFNEDDIVRSDLTREWIIARENMGMHIQFM